jgi:hypothetical protein
MDRYCVVLDGDLWIPLRYDGPLTGDRPLPDLDAVRMNSQTPRSLLPNEDCRHSLPGGFHTEKEAWDYADSLESQVSAKS